MSVNVSSKDLKTYGIETGNPSKPKLRIKIAAPSLRADNLSLQTWGSSYILANRLHSLGRTEKNAIPPLALHPKSISADQEVIPVLELGAGTGLVGLTAAALWHTNVVLTDLAPIVPGLANNISLNAGMLSAHKGDATCGTLDWAEPEAIVYHPPTDDNAMPQKVTGLRSSQSGAKARVILAADTVYSEEHPSLLLNTILARLERSEHARVVIAYPMRVAYLDTIRDLWQRFEEAGLLSISEGRAETHDFDDEVLHEWSVWKWSHD